MLKFFSFTLLITGLIIIPGCLDIPDEIVMPQWDVDLNIPLTDKTYILDDIIKSQNYISIDPQDSIYIITSDDYSQVTGITQFIKAVPETKNLNNDVTSGNDDSTEIFLEFPDGAKLDQAEFFKGTIKITARNPSAEFVNLSVRIPGLEKPEGGALNIEVEIPPFDSVTRTGNLKDFSYNEPSNQLFLFKGQLWMIAKATAPDIVTVTFDAFTSDLYFKNVTGYLPPKSLDIQKNTFGLDLGTQTTNYRGKVINTNGVLRLKGSYNSHGSIPFPVEVRNLKLTGKRNDGNYLDLKFNNSSSLTLQFDNTGNLDIRFTEENSNINNFITFIPDSVTLTAEYIMNPDNSTEYKTASDGDSIVFTTSFQTTSILAISKVTLEDTLKIEFTEDQRKQIKDGKGAQLSIQTDNAIPLSAWLKATITDNLYRPLFVITRSSNNTDSLFLPGAVINSGGNVQAPSNSVSFVTLSAEEIEMLSNGYYAIISVTIETSGHTSNNPPLVFIKANDWIKLNSYGKLTYRVKE